MITREDNCINTTAKEVRVGDEIGISIVNYHGWEKVTKVETRDDGTIVISTCDCATYGPDEKVQIKRSDAKRPVEQPAKKYSADNLVLKTDSYKFSHPFIFPEGMDYMHNYLEARGGDFPATSYFGLQGSYSP